jgi:hypothetical protein
MFQLPEPVVIEEKEKNYTDGLELMGNPLPSPFTNEHVELLQDKVITCEVSDEEIFYPLDIYHARYYILLLYYYHNSIGMYILYYTVCTYIIKKLFSRCLNGLTRAVYPLFGNSLISSALPHLPCVSWNTHGLPHIRVRRP